MKHIKKILLTITAFALVLSMSGCYWKGNTKHHSEQLILNALEDKYNEKFFIREIAVRSSYPGRPLAAYCSPKDDEELIFEVQYQEYEYDDPKLQDTYIPMIVRREMKEKIDIVLAEYYDDFAVEVHVSGLSNAYDSGIRNAEEASIITFTDALPEKNASTIFIAINKNEVNDYDEIESLLVECVKDFHYTSAVIECYFADNEIIEECNKIINDNFPDALDIMTVLSPGKCLDDIYILHHYYYYGTENNLSLIEVVDSDGSHRFNKQIN